MKPRSGPSLVWGWAVFSLWWATACPASAQAQTPIIKWQAEAGAEEANILLDPNASGGKSRLLALSAEALSKVGADGKPVPLLNVTTPGKLRRGRYLATVRFLYSEPANWLSQLLLLDFTAGSSSRTVGCVPPDKGGIYQQVTLPVEVAEAEVVGLRVEWRFSNPEEAGKAISSSSVHVPELKDVQGKGIALRDTEDKEDEVLASIEEGVPVRRLKGAPYVAVDEACLSEVNIPAAVLALKPDRAQYRAWDIANVKVILRNYREAEFRGTLQVTSVREAGRGEILRDEEVRIPASGDAELSLRWRIVGAEIKAELLNEKGSIDVRSEPLPVGARFDFAYQTFYKSLRYWFEWDGETMPGEDLKEAACEACVRRQGQDAALGSSKGSWEKGFHLGQFSLPPLGEGTYRAEFRILDRKGASLYEERKVFERVLFPWEHNRIGKSDVVVPPYTPLKTGNDRIEPWGRAYTIGPSGLPRQIQVLGTDILRMPIRLLSVQNGKELELRESASSPSFPQRTAHRVAVQGRATLGEIETETNAFMDYDGWYQVKLALRPAKAEVAVESLDLAIDLWEGADTFTIFRSWDSPNAGAIPAGKGVVWDSTKEPAYPWLNMGTFIPVVYVGAGDRGLWWYGESDKGWANDYAKPCVQIERDDEGRPRVRFRFFNTKAAMKERRTVEFAILAQPTKPLPPGWRKTAWYQGNPYVDYTEGYRHWGDGQNSFNLQTEEDLEAFAEYVVRPAEMRPEDAGCMHWEGRVRAFRADPQHVPLVLYASNGYVGISAPEFRAFAGEWLASNGSMTGLQTDPKGFGYNYARTVHWLDPEQTAVRGWFHYTPSYTDFYVWSHRRLFERAPVNGTEWDNADLFSVPDYDERGFCMGYKWNTFYQRELKKRMCTMVWELGRRPFFVRECPSFSWCHAAWFTEGYVYVFRPAMTLLEQLSVDRFRALHSIYGGLIPNIRSNSEMSVSNPMAARSVMGLALLHDMGCDPGSLGSKGGHENCTKMLRILDREVNYFDESACEFLPYWATPETVKAEDAGVRVTAYRNKGIARALLVLLNENPQKGGITTRLRIADERLLGHKAKRLYDPWVEEPQDRLWMYDGEGPKAGAAEAKLQGDEEEAEETPPLSENLDVDKGKFEEIPRQEQPFWGPVRMRRHDFRLLVLE
jgi:hypothetical protein